MWEMKQCNSFFFSHFQCFDFLSFFFLVRTIPTEEATTVQLCRAEIAPDRYGCGSQLLKHYGQHTFSMSLQMLNKHPSPLVPVEDWHIKYVLVWGPMCTLLEDFRCVAFSLLCCPRRRRSTLRSCSWSGPCTLAASV